MSTSQARMNPGAILSGRWQIQDFIGSGDMAEVYGVRDMHSTGTFALKLFWPNALAQPEIWSALQQTARTASGLGVDGVARAYDFGIDANSGRPFFVSERVSWSALADRVRVRGPLTPADMANALGVLARALDAAHRVGLVHRDLKPENVFVSPENANWVRISDFGVALLRSAAPPPPGWGGTVGWVAPDAADRNARSTPAMDVYALGLVTFFALSGGQLHRAARANPIDPGALWQELGVPLDSASTRARELGASLDPAFDHWFQRACAPNPQMRFATVAEMASAFEAIARTLFAPQSQNAVALHGVAAAIAQPLIFQPESLPPPAAPAAPAPMHAEVPTAVSAQYVPNADSAPSSSIPGVKKKTAAPLFIGGALICCLLFAGGAYALFHHRQAAAEEAAVEAAASASAAASAALASAAAATPPVAAVPATTPSSVAAAEPTPPPTETAALAPSAVAVAAPSPSPAKTAAALVPTSKPAAAATTQPTAKPAAVATAKPAAVASAKPVATAAASAKPKTAATTATVPKKKCGSVFIPCK